MERGNTKYEILDAALTLFSTGGYEATSRLQKRLESVRHHYIVILQANRIF